MALGAAFSMITACRDTGASCSRESGSSYRTANADQHRGALLWLRCAESNLFSCDEAREYDLPDLQKRKEAIIARAIECEDALKAAGHITSKGRPILDGNLAAQFRSSRSS